MSTGKTKTLIGALVAFVESIKKQGEEDPSYSKDEYLISILEQAKLIPEIENAGKQLSGEVLVDRWSNAIAILERYARDEFFKLRSHASNVRLWSYFVVILVFSVGALTVTKWFPNYRAFAYAGMKTICSSPECRPSPTPIFTQAGLLCWMLYWWMGVCIGLFLGEVSYAFAFKRMLPHFLQTPGNRSVEIKAPRGRDIFFSRPMFWLLLGWFAVFAWIPGLNWVGSTDKWWLALFLFAVLAATPFIVFAQYSKSKRRYWK